MGSGNSSLDSKSLDKKQKNAMKERFYQKIVENLDQEECREIEENFPKRKTYLEIQQTLYSQEFPYLIPSTASIENQTKWTQKYFLSSQFLNIVHYPKGIDYEKPKIFYQDGLQKLISFEEIFDFLHDLHIANQHKDRWNDFPSFIWKIYTNLCDIYKDLCDICAKKDLNLKMAQFDMERDMSTVSFLEEEKKENEPRLWKYQIRTNPLMTINYSREISMKYSDLWDELKWNIVKVYNHDGSYGVEHFHAISRPIFAMAYIKPLLLKRNFDKNEIYLRIDRNVFNFLNLFTNEIRTLETIQSDKEFLAKYSKLWWLFLKGTFFLEDVFSQFQLLSTDYIESQLEKNRSRNRYITGFDNGTPTYESRAMLTWKNGIFSQLYSKLTSTIANLIEKERSGEIYSATSIIPENIIQSFKVLDDEQEQGGWEPTLLNPKPDFRLLESFLTSSHEKFAVDQKMETLKVTMLDVHNFMKFFNAFIYTYVQRPLVIQIEALLNHPCQTEEHQVNSNGNNMLKTRKRKIINQ